MTTHLCATCMWFDRNHPNAIRNKGACRLRAPRVVADQDGAMTCWPFTTDTDYCGEWVSKSKPRKPEEVTK